MEDLIDPNYTSLQDKLAALFKASADWRGQDSRAIPLQGDLRIHMSMDGQPSLSVIVTTTPYLFQRAYAEGIRDVGHPDIFDGNIVAAYLKAPEAMDKNKPCHVFFDVNIPSVEASWRVRSPEYFARFPDAVTSFDSLVRNLKFQFCCALMHIDMIETKNVQADLSYLKSVAIDKADIKPGHEYNLL